MNGFEDPTTGKAVTTHHPHPHASAPPANETNHSPASITPSSGANARRQPNELEGPGFLTSAANFSGNSLPARASVPSNRRDLLGELCAPCACLVAEIVSRKRYAVPTTSNYRPAAASFPASKFTYSRTAPGTPAGNCRKNAYPV